MIDLLERVMDSFSWTSALLTVAICLALFVCVQWAHMPPGPTGLPYLGYYPFLSDDNFYKELDEMKKKYGDVFCFTITGQVYVHLGSFKAMREALVTKSECFMKKPGNFNLLKDSVSSGVFYESGEVWKVLRKFFSQKLKDYGMGKKSQEMWLGDSLQRTVDALKKSDGKDFDLMTFFTENCSVAIRQLLFGPVEVDDDVTRRFLEAFQTIIFSLRGTRLLLAGPLFKYVIQHFIPDIAKYRKAKDEVDSMFGKILRDHGKDFDMNNIRNLVDCYIDERRILKEKGDTRYKFYTEKAFSDTILQIFGDGSLTNGLLAATLIKIVADHPDVLKKIQSEVDEVVGRERFPTWEERNRMPYTVAVINEIIRTGNFFPIFPSLECTAETTVCGCRVPKGSILLQNFYSALRDPKSYDEPEKFDPARFLPKEDKKSKTELPTIFGMGKRSCLGESLANMEAFVFLTTVVQNFDVLPVPSEGKIMWLESTKISIRATPRKIL